MNRYAWHYVKDGEYPTTNDDCLVAFYFEFEGEKRISYGIRSNLKKDFENIEDFTKQIIAWKEIVLPELKESE